MTNDVFQQAVEKEREHSHDYDWTVSCSEQEVRGTKTPAHKELCVFGTNYLRTAPVQQQSGISPTVSHTHHLCHQTLPFSSLLCATCPSLAAIFFLHKTCHNAQNTMSFLLTLWGLSFLAETPVRRRGGSAPIETLDKSSIAPPNVSVCHSALVLAALRWETAISCIQEIMRLKSKIW